MRIVILLLLLVLPVQAKWKPEYSNAPQSVRDWYENAQLTPQAQERFPFKKCCEQSEVVKTQFRVNKKNGGDEWLWLDGDKWKIIPSDIIHYDQHAPDGKPTLFVYEGRETCFFIPDGGI